MFSPTEWIAFRVFVLQNGLLHENENAHSRFRVFAFSCSQVLSHVQSNRMDCFSRFRATEWIASVHTLHMPKAVITFVFIVLRNGLLRYIPYACAKL